MLSTYTAACILSISAPAVACMLSNYAAAACMLSNYAAACIPSISAPAVVCMLSNNAAAAACMLSNYAAAAACIPSNYAAVACNRSIYAPASCCLHAGVSLLQLPAFRVSLFQLLLPTRRSSLQLPAC